MDSPQNSGEKTTAKQRLSGEGEAWMALSKSLKEAQSALDKNRLLIQQVNENHQSKISENMVKNVALINEINGNISKVSDVYSSLSVNFASFVRDTRVKKKGEKMLPAKVGILADAYTRCRPSMITKECDSLIIWDRDDWYVANVTQTFATKLKFCSVAELGFHNRMLPAKVGILADAYTRCRPSMITKECDSLIIWDRDDCCDSWVSLVNLSMRVYVSWVNNTSQINSGLLLCGVNCSLHGHFVYFLHKSVWYHHVPLMFNFDSTTHMLTISTSVWIFVTQDCPFASVIGRLNTHKRVVSVEAAVLGLTQSNRPGFVMKTLEHIDVVNSRFRSLALVN
ncbi:hypothetical protein CTI12_AA255160 [Artemisia annua]|uniref:Protein EARLY FLOWERING 4 domain-containing protein n=1 Tax=Artemisia annua TaxID=35608 RepID=A0A2U1NKR5_ARTAN|nr:hypothetical protein CTI12_AA255160 [Artemisia annua]